MSIEKEVLAVVAPAIKEAFDKPVPLDPKDVDMIQSLIARLKSLEMLVGAQNKAIAVLQATLAAMKG